MHGIMNSHVSNMMKKITNTSMPTTDQCGCQGAPNTNAICDLEHVGVGECKVA